MFVGSLAALRVINSHSLAQFVLDAFENRDPFYAVRAIAISRQAVVVGVRANDGDGMNFSAEWQNVLVVFE